MIRSKPGPNSLPLALLLKNRLTMPSFDFIKEYLAYNLGNECPRSYHTWAALVAIAAAAHKRFHIHWGYFDIYPNIYVGFVGDQGKTRKSSARDIMVDLFQSVFPDYPIGASVESCQVIIKTMASDACLFSFKDHNDTIVEVRPMLLVINEMADFFSIDPAKMVDFLTNIYDRKHYKSVTIKRGEEEVNNPCMNILACATPKWIQERMKGSIISGGFARRIIYIYEMERTARIPFPEKPVGADVMWKNLQTHLRGIGESSGLFSWSPDAREFWAKWYTSIVFPEDDIMSGYYESKHIQVLKVSMLLALTRAPLSLILTQELLELAIAHLDAIEGNMVRLTRGSGRNELAIPIQNALDLLEKTDGWLPEKTFRRLLGKDLSPMEIIQVMRFLQETDQLFIQKVNDGTVERVMVMTKEKYEKRRKQN